MCVCIKRLRYNETEYEENEKKNVFESKFYVYKQRNNVKLNNILSLGVFVVFSTSCVFMDSAKNNANEQKSLDWIFFEISWCPIIIATAIRNKEEKNTRKQNIHNNNGNNKSLLKHWVVWVQQIKWIQENKKKSMKNNNNAINDNIYMKDSWCSIDLMSSKNVLLTCNPSIQFQVNKILFLNI